jgi:lantibiotic modifying enzyme
MLRHKQAAGRYRFTGSEGGIVFNPALFHGSAGIGYTLLRCCAPGEIVSLLQQMDRRRFSR